VLNIFKHIPIIEDERKVKSSFKLGSSLSLSYNGDPPWLPPHHNTLRNILQRDEHTLSTSDWILFKSGINRDSGITNVMLVANSRMVDDGTGSLESLLQQLFVETDLCCCLEVIDALNADSEPVTADNNALPNNLEK